MYHRKHMKEYDLRTKKIFSAAKDIDVLVLCSRNAVQYVSNHVILGSVVAIVPKDYDPSLLITLNWDLERVKDAKIPVVICPRSYLFFRLKNNLELMKKTGVSLLLGTDNGMINTADVLQEVHLLRSSGVFSLEELLTMVTYTPRKALNLDDCIQGRDLSENVVVLERDSLKPVYVSK